MTTFIIFLVISAVFWGGLIYKTWQMDDQQKEQIAHRVQDIKVQSTERLQNLSVRMPTKPAMDAELPARFRAWSGDAAFVSEELYRWMADLSDEHFQVITEFVAQFCDDMGFELQGVIEGHYAERDLDDTLERVVVHIIQSMHLIFSVREDLLIYEAEKPAQPEIAGQIQQMMSNGVASVNGVLNRSGLNGSVNGHSH